MNDSFAIVTGIHWTAVIIYVVATLANFIGLFFKKDKAISYSLRIVLLGLVVHGAGILYWWRVVGHGPYMTRFEVLSSNAWIALFLYLMFSRLYPKISSASIFVFPSTFLLIAVGIFFNPAVKNLPPTLRSIWLVLHVAFYKISLATLLIALAFSLFYIIKKRTKMGRLDRLPDQDVIDLYSFRFAGFGFTFWAIAMLSGSIWAYQSWGRFWAWDPVETWSLITWVFLGVYLHLRRFFGWKGDKAALFFIVVFLVSLIAIFFTPFVGSSIHSEYFR